MQLIRANGLFRRVEGNGWLGEDNRGERVIGLLRTQFLTVTQLMGHDRRRVPRACPEVRALIGLGTPAGGRQFLAGNALPHLAGDGNGSLRRRATRRDRERMAGDSA